MQGASVVFFFLQRCGRLAFPRKARPMSRGPWVIWMPERGKRAGGTWDWVQIELPSDFCVFCWLSYSVCVRFFFFFFFSTFWRFAPRSRARFPLHPFLLQLVSLRCFRCPIALHKVVWCFARRSTFGR